MARQLTLIRLGSLHCVAPSSAAVPGNRGPCSRHAGCSNFLLEGHLSELLALCCCSRGMSPNDVGHFPYCVAEVKLQVQDVPPWLLGVVQSGGAKLQPGLHMPTLCSNVQRTLPGGHSFCLLVPHSVCPRY